MPPRKDRLLSYPEIIMAGPMRKVLDLLRSGDDPIDAHQMAQRVHMVKSATTADANWTSFNLDSYLYWALHKWERSGCPMFTMDGELAWAITHTEPPMATFDLLPEIPVDGMYITMPPVFDIGDDESGRHRIEGIFLTVNEILVPLDGRRAPGPIARVTPEERQDFFSVRGITVLGIGEDKAPDLHGRIARGEAWKRDDWVVFFNLIPGQPLFDGEEGPTGVQDLIKVVSNLLYLLQNTNSMREEAEPHRPEFSGTDRRARRERERHQAKGRSVYPHRVWHLSTLDRTPMEDESKVLSGRRVSGHVVLGHIHRYWVLDPAGCRSLGTQEVATKTKGTRTYHLVARWILPYVRGEGPPSSPRVHMR